MLQPDTTGENALDEFHNLSAADQRAILNLLTASQRRRISAYSRRREKITPSANSPVALHSPLMAARIAEVRAGDGASDMLTPTARAALERALGPNAPEPAPSFVQAVSGLLRSKGMS